MYLFFPPLLRTLKAFPTFSNDRSARVATFPFTVDTLLRMEKFFSDVVSVASLSVV